MISLNQLFGILSIVGSIITVYLAYRIYTYNRSSKGWLAVILAFVLIIFRRSIGFLVDAGLFQELKSALKPIEGALLLVISVLYIWGFWAMLKNFESFEVLGREIKNKIRGKRK